MADDARDSAASTPAEAPVNTALADDTIIYVLLATYNGARYIEAQIASLQSQTHAEWQLLVRDDGSTDDTTQRVQALAANDPRIELVADDVPRNLGACANFSVLLDHAATRGAPYACFCDQDDVWHPDKLAVELQAAQAIDARRGPNHPVLVYSDLEVVDAELNPLNRSFYAYQGIPLRDQEPPLQTLLAQNHVVGCTTLFNRALITLAAPVPPDVFMHDWWIALCAGACGTVERLARDTVRYRQHGANEVGAGGLRRLRSLNSFRQTLRKMNRICLSSIVQAERLTHRMQERGVARCPCAGSRASLAQVRDWGHVQELGLADRLLVLARSRAKSLSLPLTLLLYLQLLFFPLIRRRHPSRRHGTTG